MPTTATLFAIQDRISGFYLAEDWSMTSDPALAFKCGTEYEAQEVLDILDNAKRKKVVPLG